jgi:hypothetical protein|tara:strand:- start:793 stop:987 length:195 start_codon:yes stop_codon:yes gene_type:complete
LKKGKPLALTAAITRRDLMEKIALSTDLVNGILQYLGSQPFVQVAQLINAIQQEAKPPAEPAGE